ncbi:MULTISPECIES: phosphoenolpyruvate--protein phosphotransferase [Cysteiniphilum]|uniref:phosphoenolpyruvate--protein phosphotransferase n=1 Tax=Cysteiniphilum litorale TaxID=2056700 RepID=A0A8J2Z2K4_9GAMM|nr:MULTISPECIES: phosphoenolpyruvate--protein phosphotransferase [Cysteiniphilum]GGF89772.1 phosphoenolpyruvate--protein phosphotransferase [Cysteiniphilum litorale]
MLWQPLVKIIELKHELDVVLSMFAKEACKVLSVDACSVFILDETEHTYTLSASTLVPTLRSGMIYISAKDDLLGKVALREEALIITDMSKASSYSVLQTLSRNRLQSLLAAPVVHKGEVIAIIALQLNDKDKITESLQTDVATLCANLSLPLNRAIHIEDVSEQIEDKPQSPMYFDGVSANDGVQKGIAVARYNITDIEEIPDKPTQSDDEERLFISAVKDVKESLEEMLERVTLLAGSEEAQLFEAYLQMIDSSRFYDAIIGYIRQGIWLQSAIKRVVIEQATLFEQMDEPYFVERASDIRDLGKRILLALENKILKKSHYAVDTVLVASEVTASMIAEVPKGRLKAIISEHGSSYSHAAILAKALSVPFVTSIKALPISFIDGKEVIVDAYVGRIYIQPAKGLKSAYERLIKHESQKAVELQALKDLSSTTIDGHEITLKANVGLIADLDRALSQGAAGVGLYRSEIPFMIRERFPSEDEQRIIYQQILSTFPNKPAVLRTLDVGADKTLPYFYEEEQNPALGWRGIRMLLDQSNLFLMQIRAMLKASLHHDNLHILLPMITTIEEVKEAKQLIRQAYKEVIEEGFDIDKPRIGIMIEVPAAVVLAERLIDLIDFVSIGSNDLAQYILAVDRTNEKVANLYNQLHPAMIRTLYHLVKVAKKHNKEISLCGELGGNPIATALLVGMGFDSLSMNASALLKVKQVLRSVTKKQCRNVLKQVLKLATTDEVHTYLENFLVENDLGGLIRAGIN